GKPCKYRATRGSGARCAGGCLVRRFAVLLLPRACDVHATIAWVAAITAALPTCAGAIVRLPVNSYGATCARRSLGKDRSGLIGGEIVVVGRGLEHRRAGIAGGDRLVGGLEQQDAIDVGAQPVADRVQAQLVPGAGLHRKRGSPEYRDRAVDHLAQRDGVRASQRQEIEILRIDVACHEAEPAFLRSGRRGEGVEACPRAHYLVVRRYADAGARIAADRTLEPGGR